MPLNITHTGIRGENPKEIYKNVFQDIGNYLKFNADRFSENIPVNHAGMKIEIDIPINGLVVISTKFDEVVTKESIETVNIDKVIDK